MTLDLEKALQAGLADRYRLTGVAYEDSTHAVFNAEGLRPEAFDSTAVVVQLSGSEPAEFNRYLEAGFLSHPNLVKVFHVGWVEVEDARFPYLVTERPDGFLNNRLHEHVPTSAEMIELGTQVAAALSYLHSENLIYCALNAATIWRVGDRWKLADYSQLRVPGMEKSESLRSLLVHGNVAAPPEAFFGRVTPAWDVWSLGNLLGKILRPLPKRGATQELRATPLVCPDLDEAVADMSAPDPAERPSVEELVPRLEALLQQLEQEKAAESVTMLVTNVPAAVSDDAADLSPALPEEASAEVTPDQPEAASIPLRYIPFAASRSLGGAARFEAPRNQDRFPGRECCRRSFWSLPS